MKLFNKIPRIAKLLATIDYLKDEIKARDEFGEQLIDENERLTQELTDLKHDYESLTTRVRDMQDDSTMWSKRWQDEHEKYSDLCDQLRGMMIQLKDSAENVLAHTTIDT